MPILDSNRPNPIVYSPQRNYAVARYIDINKFISLISTRKLFFSRIDEMEDKFEGTLPTMNRKLIENWYNNINKDPLADNISVDDEVASHFEMFEKYKKFCTISCWNKYNSETYALWKIYSDINKGIMIKTNIKNIIGAFQNTEDKVLMSEVKYVDHEKDTIEDGSIHLPLLYKNMAYEYEKELRLMYQYEIVDLSKPPLEKGKYIDVDIDKLIGEIIISPYAPEWFFDNIKSLLEKYSIDKPVKYSKLKP
ncbi:MAG: hypothetical protein CUR32_12255 [Flavobacterium sp.]|nr:MAG: hypothetical protein CUR32_12255 [Flavobacterium sp.] [Flavobacterium sp. FEMGT703F]